MIIRAALILGIVCWAATPVAAQSRSPRYELGLQALTLVRGEDPSFIGGGLYAAIRPGGNARVVASTALGGMRGHTVVRGELLAHFLLSPRRARGVSPYGIGGLAGIVATDGGGTAGYMVLGAGLESAPGARSGWALEVGVGGGVRLTAGWRLRW